MRVKIVMLAALLSVGAFARTEVTSDAMLLYIRPELSSFWRTVVTNVVLLPIDLPNDSTSASLTVEGVGYSRAYNDIPSGMFELQLPAADSSDKENVYDLTLSFGNDVIRKAKIGVIEGKCARVDEFSTRCRLSESGLTWRKAMSRSVIPIPYGMTSISVARTGDDSEVVLLDGAQGWYALGPMKLGSAYNLVMSDDEVSISTEVLACNPGIVVVVR